MTGHRKQSGSKHNPLWKEILDFGPDRRQTKESCDQQKEVNERLKKLVKQLHDLNRRLDNLND